MSKNPTPRQRKAAKEVVLNLLSKQPVPTGKVLENIGYSKGISETPQMVLGTEGFKIALAETGLREALIAEGINPKKIAQKINVLLNAVDKEGTSDYTAIDKGLKHATSIYGITNEKPTNNNTYNFILNPTFQQQIKPLEEALKRQFRNVRPNETTEEALDADKEV